MVLVQIVLRLVALFIGKFFVRRSAELASMRSVSDHSLASVSSKDESFRYYRHAEAGFGRLEVYFLQNQMTDVTLIAGTEMMKFFQ